MLNDYAQYEVPDGALDMEYNFWMLRAWEKIILVDTGYDISAGNSAKSSRGARCLAAQR